MRIAPLAAALACLAVPATAAVEVANPVHDRLMRMSPELKRAAMRQAVTNNGFRCGRVETADFQQPWRNLMMWTARCSEGGDFAVYVGKDSSVQARRCADAASLKLPLCRMPAAKPAPRRR